MKKTMRVFAFLLVVAAALVMVGCDSNEGFASGGVFR